MSTHPGLGVRQGSCPRFALRLVFPFTRGPTGEFRHETPPCHTMRRHRATRGAPSTRLAILLALVAALGCSSSSARLPVAYSEYRKGEDFGAYERFASLKGSPEAARQTQPLEHELHELIQGALSRELTRRGYVLTTADDADFLVTFHCRTADELTTKVIDREWQLDDGDGVVSVPITPRRVISTIRKGSIVIDFVTPRERRRTWRGVARGRVSSEATGDELSGMVVRAVREILAEFPPPP